MPLVEVLDAWAMTPAAVAAAFVLGTVFGSFANVCIVRLPPTDDHPRGRSIASPPSHCQACGTPIRWYDNLPIVSYLWLRGRCRACGVRYSPRYLLVEAATGLLFAGAYALCVTSGVFDGPLAIRLGRFAVYAVFSFALVVIAFIDIDHRLILNRVTYPAIPAFYALGLVLPERRWYEGLVGAAVGYGIVRLISDGYYWMTRREGLGYGDGKLLAIVGALFGWQAVFASLFAGALVGSVVMIPALAAARRRDLRHAEVPFGPFLAAGAIAYMYGESWVKVSFSLLWGGPGG
ncbi:MAG: prepilin peptidase [Deltaproteobacteria bacterium]|nr:MAG: prepilin peptidase [Deltaproteobacteria bacterium]